MAKIFWAIAAISLAAPVQAQAADKQLERLFAMTVDDFAEAASIKDDEMEAVAEIDTEKGFKYKSGIFGSVVADGFVRAFVNKVTGQVKYQIYYYINNDGPSWLFINYANVMGANGLEAIDTINIGRDVSCTRYGCNKLEQIAIPVGEQDMRWAANRVSEKGKGLAVRLKTQVGRDLDFTIVAAEVAGLMKVVEKYKSDRHLP